MIIDIHVHTAKKRHPKLTRPNGSHYPDPETLIGMMNDAGIDKAVVMCTVNPEFRYTIVTPEEVLDICRQYPDRLIPFCNIDPRYLTNSPQADFSSLLEAYKDLGCKGMGECIPNLPFDHPLCMNLFTHVEKAGLPLTFHIGPQEGSCYGFIDDLGLPRLEKVLQAFPDLNFLAHSQPFWAEIGANRLDEDGNRIPYPKGPVEPGRVVELMRRYPNLLGDLSAGSGFGAISRDPAFGYAFMEEFQDRLFFGTDIANVPQDLPIAPYFRSLKEQRLISESAYEKITWRNANRLLSLGLE
ncbi:MAG TPA: amidohydrolase family protein [Candidatus Hydrogenedentes bacterium]|nr:amidohydrolase family protein [Candidatus Hydrogenedentota bacterium]HPG67227.1 amidohydrolase family protein [Candidatus Hydrogenedentota bacterium]